MDKVTIFYHNDHDGICAAAIVLQHFPGAKCYTAKYQRSLRTEEIEDGQMVYIVDFTPEPIEELIGLYKKCGKNLIWIDHHKSAIKAEKEYNLQDIQGVRTNGTSGCELTWTFLNGGPRPQIVHHLGRFDVWDHKEKDTVPCEYGMRIKNPRPDSPIWGKLLNHNVETDLLINSIISDGYIAYDFEQSQNKKIINSQVYPIIFKGYKSAVINRAYMSTLHFKDLKNKDDYDLFIWYYYDKDHWEVRVATEKDNINVLDICEPRGGGGHEKIGGFRVDDISEFIID